MSFHINNDTYQSHTQVSHTNMTQILLHHLQLGQALPFYFIGLHGALGYPEFPVALLGSHPMNTLHLRAIRRTLMAQDTGLPHLHALYQKLQAEILHSMGKMSVEGVLSDTVLPLFPPCAWRWARALTVCRFTDSIHLLLLSAVYYEAREQY